MLKLWNIRLIIFRPSWIHYLVKSINSKHCCWKPNCHPLFETYMSRWCSINHRVNVQWHGTCNPIYIYLIFNKSIFLHVKLPWKESQSLLYTLVEKHNMVWLSEISRCFCKCSEWVLGVLGISYNTISKNFRYGEHECTECFLGLNFVEDLRCVNISLLVYF